MKLIVYHIYCVGNYKEIVLSQIKRLKESGLYEWCDVIEVSCVDTSEKFEGIDQLFEGMSKVNLFKTPRNSFEYWGIKKVWDLSQKYDGQVFYFHTKGVSNTYTNLITNEVNDWKSYGVSYWREMLEYFLIDNFNECLKQLENYDSCGVTCYDGWFWGNFWWSNLSYIRNNNEPIHGDRWYFEAWLNHGRLSNNYEFYKLNFNLYFSNLPSDLYKGGLKNNVMTIESAQYGTLGIQQDEGYPSEIPVLQTDVTDKVKHYLKNNQLLVSVDSSIFGNPAHGHRKFLIINIKINNEPYRVVFNEGFQGKLSL